MTMPLGSRDRWRASAAGPCWMRSFASEDALVRDERCVGQRDLIQFRWPVHQVFFGVRGHCALVKACLGYLARQFRVERAAGADEQAVVNGQLAAIPP